MDDEISDQQCLDVKEDSGCFISKMADAPDHDEVEERRAGESRVGEFESKAPHRDSDCKPGVNPRSGSYRQSDSCPCRKEKTYVMNEDATSLHGSIIGCHDEFLKSCDLETEIPVSAHDIELNIPVDDIETGCAHEGDEIWDSQHNLAALCADVNDDPGQDYNADDGTPGSLEPEPQYEPPGLTQHSCHIYPDVLRDVYRMHNDSRMGHLNHSMDDSDRQSNDTIYEDDEEEYTEMEKQALENILGYNHGEDNPAGYFKHYTSLKRNIVAKNLETVCSASDTDSIKLGRGFRCGDGLEDNNNTKSKESKAKGKPADKCDSEPTGSDSGSVNSARDVKSHHKNGGSSAHGKKVSRGKAGTSSRNQSFKSAKRVSFRLRHER